MTAANVEVGVFYDRRDHVGVGSRFVIDVLDTVAATLVCGVVSVVLLLVWPHDRSAGLAVLCAWLGVWVGYFVFLKRSRFRTLGYVAAHARVVNLQGHPPSILSLIIRLVWVVAGPANFLIDVFWIPTDPEGQALRDKFAHTYVVRKDALPAGTGKIVYRTYCMLGTTFFFQEVQRPNLNAA